MGTVIQIKGKTEQRVERVLRALRSAPAGQWLSYTEISKKCGTPYDVLLYILATLVEVGLIERQEAPARTPGRPKVTFRWVAETDSAVAHAMGA